MKNNLWKVLVVAILIAAVVAVVAVKNKNSGEKTAVASKEAASIPAQNQPENQVSNQADNSVQDSNAASKSPEADKETGNIKLENKPSDEVKPGEKALATDVKKPVEKQKVEESKKISSEKKIGKKPEAKDAPKKLPKLLELGADQCMPCKMMKPIIEELKNEYKGRLIVEFIDVWKNQEAAEKYGIRSIPTQIFFNEKGEEIFRHTGYFPKEDILATFKEHNIILEKGSTND